MENEEHTQALELEPIKWKAEEYEYVPKNRDWFWALGIIALSTSVASFIFGNYLFAVFILISAGAIGFSAAKKPDIINYEISEDGIVIKKTLFPYSQVKGFSVDIDVKNQKRKLLFLSDRFFMPIISIPLGDADEERVRSMLLEYSEEMHITEPLTQKFMEYIGF